MKVISDYVYQAGYLCNGIHQNVHGSHLRLYSDLLLNTETIMAHIVFSETGMPVQRLMNLMEANEDLMAQVCWSGSPEPEDHEPVAKLFEDIRRLFEKLL